MTQVSMSERIKHSPRIILGKAAVTMKTIDSEKILFIRPKTNQNADNKSQRNHISFCVLL